ncbi:MAG: hypothetical protein IJI84_01330 [Clostridia bacterium]|nr:hypothetical protein [Clostridia bacterium]
MEIKSLLKSKNYSKYPQPQGSFPKGRTSDFSIEVYKRSDKSEQGDFLL